MAQIEQIHFPEEYFLHSIVSAASSQSSPLAFLYQSNPAEIYEIFVVPIQYQSFHKHQVYKH
jgi:hypothetical protein